MADKELRGMNRTELIEIIYALQQNERMLRTENEQLRRQLDDKILRMEKAGSIAEAALSLNHIFEDAEAAAQQYLDSLRAMSETAEPQTEKTEDEAAQIQQAEGEDQAGPKDNEDVTSSQEEESQEESGTRRPSAWGANIKAVYQRFVSHKTKE